MLLPVAGAAALASLVLAPAGAARAAAEAPVSPVLIGDLTLSAYATVAARDAPAADAYVRMERLIGASPTQRWELRDHTDGGTAVVNESAGSCLTVTPLGIGPWVEQRACGGGPLESWDIRSGDDGTVFVNRATGTCLTQPPAIAPPGQDSRLSAVPCDDGPEQLFGLVV
ncbi:RICIN domain-containing protein [Streptomyces sp. PT12]|uniref:RICIN domain-containing protein n=1 Tax=Streptomyces sp. PT12 TaxID=1510197 RepID=UPI0015EF1174|nr:RICIN domain-containing protein [Streptomyces sp. PT12]